MYITIIYVEGRFHTAPSSFVLHCSYLIPHLPTVFNQQLKICVTALIPCAHPILLLGHQTEGTCISVLL